MDQYYNICKYKQIKCDDEKIITFGSQKKSDHYYPIS